MTQPNGTPGPDQDAVAAEWAAMVGMADDEDEARAAKPASAPEDSLAASWADALRSDDLSGGGPGAATPAAAGQGGRALNQDEIDNLLGVSAVALKKERSGIMSLVHAKEGGFTAEAQRVKRSGFGRPCQAPRAAPGGASGSRGTSAASGCG